METSSLMAICCEKIDLQYQFVSKWVEQNLNLNPSSEIETM